MPKIKTHRGVAKRVKVTKSGKVKRNQAWKRHLATAKSAKRKRHLRKSVMMPKPEERRMLRLLGLR